MTDGVNGWLTTRDRRALSFALAQIATQPGLIDRWRSALPRSERWTTWRDSLELLGCL
jgi:hypothetical protein